MRREGKTQTGFEAQTGFVPQNWAKVQIPGLSAEEK